MTNVSEAPELLTCRQAATRLGMTPRTVWRHVKDGEIPSVRIGEHGHRRIPSVYVERLIAEGLEPRETL